MTVTDHARLFARWSVCSGVTDQRQAAMSGGQTPGHAVGAVGKIEPLFRKAEQVTLVRGTARATCHFDGLCGAFRL